MAKELVTVSYINTYNEDTMEREVYDRSDLASEVHVIGAKKLKHCQMCGYKTTELELVGSLGRCEDCVRGYHAVTKRAHDYMTSNLDG